MAAATLMFSVPYQLESPQGPPVEDPVLLDAAKGFYGISFIKMYNLTSLEFSGAFPSFDLYAVMDLRRHPVEMHAMARHRTLNEVYDATMNFTTLMALEGVLLNNASQAVKYARAYAAVANPELQGEWEVLDTSDSVRLNRNVSEPTAGALLSGWNVTLSTLQRQNGVLSDWTIIFKTNQLERAEWRVVELLVGDYELDWEAVNLRVDTIVKNTYTATGYALSAFRESGGSLNPLTLPRAAEDLVQPVVATSPNFDGSEWRVRAQAATGLVSALATEGPLAYGWQVGASLGTSCSGSANPSMNWGYDSYDEDCALEIRVVPSLSLLCGACLASGNNVTLYVYEDLATYLFEELRYLNSTYYGYDALARLVTTHLHLVNLATDGPNKLPDVYHAPPGEYWLIDNSTLDTHHFAVMAIQNPAYRAFQQNLTMQGYVVAVPPLNGSRELLVAFNISAPESLPTWLLPPDWLITPVGNATWELLPHDYQEVNQPAPPPSGYIGGPGSYLVIEQPVEPAEVIARCTANFIYEDGAHWFIGSAKHCHNGLLANSNATLGLCPNCAAQACYLKASLFGSQRMYRDSIGRFSIFLTTAKRKSTWVFHHGVARQGRFTSVVSPLVPLLGGMETAGVRVKRISRGPEWAS